MSLFNELTEVFSSRSYNAAGLEATRQVTNAACAMVAISGYNDSAATGYIMLFDRIGAPPNGTVALWDQKLTAGQTFNYQPVGLLKVANGLMVVNSSTPVTYTADATARYSFTVNTMLRFF